jgi:Lamin Tail Domain
MKTLTKLFSLCLCFHVLQQTPVCAQLMISEFLAVNNGGLQDEDNESSDWIEIYNYGSQPVDLGGWRLTDEAVNLAKWTFPSNLWINSGQYLVVFASDKNRTPLPPGIAHEF